MPLARCRVSFQDTEGVVHSSDVQAESVYEAVALAVAEFRQDPMAPYPAPNTEFLIAIERPLVQHRVRLSQVVRWAEDMTRDGPAGVIRRRKLRQLLGRP